MSDVNLCEGCSVMSPETRKREVPLLATTLLMGPVVHENYKGRKDTVAIEIDGEFQVYAKCDFDIAKQIGIELVHLPDEASSPGGEPPL